jgi:hypothetical protein
MNRKIACARLLTALLTLATVCEAWSQGKVATPSEFLGFEVGADRQLADYRQIRSYFNALDAASERLELQNLGPTTLGEEMFMAVISAEENLRNKSRYQEIARRLADPRGLSRDQIDKLVAEGKAIVLVTCNIHSTEIGSTQMAMEWAHALVTAGDERTKHWLNEVILLLVPSLNPDGQIMEVEWYRKYLGTPYEGGRMPWLYHYYVGHDNNRDWYMLTQKESKAMNRAVFHEWFPQVWLDEHQMGATGPRMFVPPYANPVDKTIHPLIWRFVDHIGTQMSLRLEQQGKSGVAYSYIFDAYWPGGTKNTAWWKNVVGLLTEVASTKMGTPVEVSVNELSGGGKGLIDYVPQTNFPNPWPGGLWRLRDIMDYERIASDALLENCAAFREDLLRAVAVMAQDAIASAPADEYYVIPRRQRDPVAAARLAYLLQENGAEVCVAQDETAYVIPAAQPYARFLSEFLNVQRYPRVRPTSGSSILPPYDVTAWSLPLMMGVDVYVRKLSAEERMSVRALQESDKPTGSVDREGASLYAVRPESNATTKLVNDVLKRKAGSVRIARTGFTDGGSSYPAGTIVLEGLQDAAGLARAHAVAMTGLRQRPTVALDQLTEPRIALYKPWQASMDEGWTRFVLDQYGFTSTTVDNKRIKDGKIGKDFNVLLIADITKDVIVEGKYKPEEGQMKYSAELPPEYSGGITKEGVKNVREFVEQGGTLVALGRSSEFVMEEFNIPVANALARVKAEEFNCPGALLRIHLDPHHPVTFGMPETAAAFVTGKLAFQTTIPGSEMTRTVLAWYPAEREDILLSGWIQGEEKLERKAAAVALTYGKGKIVLLGFRVQHRAQTEGTFKLLFNALTWGAMTPSR